MKFEPDYKNFKVICQRCGRIGTVNTDEFINEKTEFFKRYDCGRRGSIFNEPQVDFWLCRECLI